MIICDSLPAPHICKKFFQSAIGLFLVRMCFDAMYGSNACFLRSRSNLCPSVFIRGWFSVPQEHDVLLFSCLNDPV